MARDADAEGLRSLADETGLSPRTRELLRRVARRLDGDPPTARDKAVRTEVVVVFTMDEANAFIDEANRYQGDTSIGRNSREHSLETGKVKLIQALAATIEKGPPNGTHRSA